MAPMPIGASIAMILSLFVALTITPYLGYIFLREKDKKGKVAKREKPIEETFIYRIYNKLESPFTRKQEPNVGYF